MTKGFFLIKEEIKKMSFIKFQSAWDKTIFFGSIFGCIIVLVLTFVKYGNYYNLSKENELLKKENVQLKQQVITLEKK